MDHAPIPNVDLPLTLQPPSSLPGSGGTAARFYLLKDRVTGVLALGSFLDVSYEALLESLYTGLVDLKERGAKRLVIDVTNNGGGFVCIAHYLHILLVGAKATTVPQAGLYTTARAGPLDQEIVSVLNRDPSIDSTLSLFYNPLAWRNITNEFFDADDHWLRPVVRKVINGRQDAFSPRLGQECQPQGFLIPPPEEGLFDAKQSVIVSNGRCGSSCSTFPLPRTGEPGTSS